MKYVWTLTLILCALLMLFFPCVAYLYFVFMFK